MFKCWSWVLAGLLLGSCAIPATQSYPGPRPVHQQPEVLEGRFKITLLRATISAHRPNGNPWHIEEPDGLLPLLGGLVALSVSGPVAAGLTARALRGNERTYPPAPFVELKLGPNTFTSVSSEPTLAPRWNYPFVIDVTGYGPDAPVIVLVRDRLDGGVIGQKQLPLRTLLDRTHLRLFEVGSAITLEFQIEQIGPPAYRIHRFAVPGDKTLKQLLRSPGTWKRIPILDGDVVRIRAKGRVCPSSWRSSSCFGPEGAPRRWRKYNYIQLRDYPHAQLVAAYGDQFVSIGRQAQFRARRSGYLNLFVNDGDADNNSGQFTVVVEVNPQ